MISRRHNALFSDVCSFWGGNSCPDKEALFANLKSDLEANGPEQPSWSNYSKLDRNKYHCHLTHHYVARWKVEADNTLIMEVYYVGTREGAPY